jgi:hypothetical protein
MLCRGLCELVIVGARRKWQSSRFDSLADALVRVGCPPEGMRHVEALFAFQYSHATDPVPLAISAPATSTELMFMSSNSIDSLSGVVLGLLLIATGHAAARLVQLLHQPAKDIGSETG